MESQAQQPFHRQGNGLGGCKGERMLGICCIKSSRRSRGDGASVLGPRGRSAETLATIFFQNIFVHGLFRRDHDR